MTVRTPYVRISPVPNHWSLSIEFTVLHGTVITKIWYIGYEVINKSPEGNLLPLFLNRVRNIFFMSFKESVIFLFVLKEPHNILSACQTITLVLVWTTQSTLNVRTCLTVRVFHYQIVNDFVTQIYFFFIFLPCNFQCLIHVHNYSLPFITNAMKSWSLIFSNMSQEIYFFFLNQSTLFPNTTCLQPCSLSNSSFLLHSMS